ncbi:unnamed protein product [Thlaspi arvense]|uniref:Uncharacterized protein n=1 Tax=Thlaspi arvense TaxID=13288 RepID=A0AAU9R551_THLAR|nr:unnamed protein product [Thlaspi arvense]
MASFDKLQIDIMSGEGSKPKATKDDAYAYLRDVKDRFDGKKYNEFFKVMNDYKSQSIDRKGCIKRVEKLLKGHKDLISGFNVFLPKSLELDD